ncbi:MAG: energy transducer TonB [Bacteroidota bacterium]|nr:energy transducer TonB [Bacteroidota bacterium]MXW14597.1 energy transducer TonB [Rhodothermaceae bacterium]MDE2644635.1 energy transducer TonB [Bacteroidota bacterium]MXW33056.1 energy transducer TonB [Rhodothermaceae bacterium]MYC04506.1 energy transducer TonB [Rhodothermaceae bacterium]
MEFRKSLSTSLNKTPGLFALVTVITAIFLLVMFWNSQQESEPLEIVDQMPTLIGGINALAAEVKYPENARNDQIEGRVIVQFTIDKNGDVRDPVVVLGIGGGCDEEAVRVITEHAKFKPGVHQGRVVPVKMAIPITFKLPSQGDELAEEVRQEDLLRQGILKLRSHIDEFEKEALRFKMRSQGDELAEEVLTIVDQMPTLI